MKTIFDKATREEIIKRINTLNESSKAQWGKMNIFQMLKHCILFDEMNLGEKIYKRVFIGRLLGKMVLKKILKDEAPLSKNEPTSPFFKIQETSGNVTAEKEKWISLVKQYEQYPDKIFVHWFFGPMTKVQLGYFTYKHSDHHLRQFNA